MTQCHGPDREAGRIGNPGMDWLDRRQSGEELLLALPCVLKVDQEVYKIPWDAGVKWEE